MLQQSTYTGWDFASPIWKIHPMLNDGYPYLDWQGLIQPLDIPQNVSSVITGENLTVSWDPVSGATSYKIYSSSDPYAVFSDISGSGTFDGTSWTYPYSENRKFFYVVAVKEDKKGLNSIKKTVGCYR
ncbi:MAG: hypothetical protein KKD38_09315 [Candidatus Delongbacteria bacterium]|nr:hypothetical protein [Candidatus Delongbacteria bacterium]